MHFVMNQMGLLLPEISQKEKKGQYDSYYAKSFPNISAIFILQQLNRFNDVSRRRMATVKYYTDRLRQSKLYSKALIRYPYLSNNKEKLLKASHHKGFSLGQWYGQVIAPNEINLKKLLYTPGSCPTAEEVCKCIVNLPTTLHKNKAQKLVKLIQKIDR